MSKQAIVAELYTTHRIIAFSGGVLACIFAFYLLYGAFSFSFFQVLPALLGMLFVGAGVFFLRMAFSMNHYQVKEGQLLVLSLRGKEKKRIPLQNIQSYYEIGEGERRQLYLMTTQGEYQISASSYANYDGIRRVLIKGRKNNRREKQLHQVRLDRRTGLGFFLFGLLFLVWFGKAFLSRNQTIKVNDLVTIEGRLSAPIELDRSGKQRRPSFYLRLSEYPDFRFTLGAYGLSATDLGRLVADVDMGDQVELSILNHEFQQKISQEVPLTFWTKNFNYSSITIYGIRHFGSAYFNLQERNEARKRALGSWGIYLLIGFSLLPIAYGIRIFRGTLKIT